MSTWMSRAGMTATASWDPRPRSPPKGPPRAAEQDMLCLHQARHTRVQDGEVLTTTRWGSVFLKKNSSQSGQRYALKNPKE